VRAVIVVDVPDEWIKERVDEVYSELGRGESTPPARDYFRSRLEDIADDELRVALYGWPVSTRVEFDEV
jgi:hypothetical protein